MHISKKIVALEGVSHNDSFSPRPMIMLIRIEWNSKCINASATKLV